MENYPQKNWKDLGYQVIRGGLGAIPTAGGPLSVLYETVFSAPLDKRREQWLITLRVIVEELCSKVKELSPEKLSQNETFVTVCLHASNIAIRTHQEEKLNALRNAVFNTVKDADVDENKKLIFVRLIDVFTPLHLKVLVFLSNPGAILNELHSRNHTSTQTYYGGMRGIWEAAHPEYRGSDALIDIVMRDIYASGLSFRQEMAGYSDPLLSKLGIEFLSFINKTI